MKKILIAALILSVFAFSHVSAANRVMIMTDTIYSSTYDLPIGWENDEPIWSFSNGLNLTTSGDITALFVEFPYINQNSRIGDVFFLWTASGMQSDILLIGSVGYILNQAIPSGDMETLFFVPIEISGGEGEICIDSCFVPPAGSWYWDAGAPIGNLNPTFNDGNGPHCMPYITTYICGDANHDGLVNISDAVWILSYIFRGGESPRPLEAGDANADGVVNVSDAVWIQNYIFKGGNAPCDPY
jgi:Dockerin type I domain